MLQPGGRFYLWEVVIPEKSPEHNVFMLPLHYTLPTETRETTYGVGWNGPQRDLDYYAQLALEVGFTVQTREQEGQVVELIFSKE